jgi:hypothetical protein
MGYYTKFNLKITPEPIALERLEITREIAEIFELEDSVNLEKTHYSDFLSNEMKWYNYYSDVLKLSIKFPNFLFTLKGEGEDKDDIWIIYYKNGKSQDAPGKITFESFDETKLK